MLGPSRVTQNQSGGPVKPIVVFAAILLVLTSFAQTKTGLQGSPKPSKQSNDEPDWLVLFLDNIQRDPEQNYGHGYGDSLYVVAHQGSAVAGLMELQGSQIDPSPICMTGTFRDGVLRLQSHPKPLHRDFHSFADEPITLRGTVSPDNHDYVFHGRIKGGPFHQKVHDSHFPNVVTLRARFADEYESSWPDTAADLLATDSCACQWKKYLDQKSLVTAPCDSPSQK